MNSMFHVIYGIILPIDFHIFQRGWNHQPDDLTMKNTVKNIHEKLADKAGWLVTFCGNFIICWDFTTILNILYVLYVDGVSGKPKPNPCKIRWLVLSRDCASWGLITFQATHGWSLGVIKRGEIPWESGNSMGGVVRWPSWHIHGGFSHVWLLDYCMVTS